MKKYDSYKDSSIEWIGEIPKHWEIKRLKNIGKLYSGLSGKSGSDFEKTPTENYKPFINFTNIANNKYIVNDNFGYVKIDEHENQNKVKKNDLFFLMSSENHEDVGKSALLLEDYDELYLNSFCKGFRLNNNFDARFVNYLLTSSALSQLISLEGRGFTRINLRMEGVENLPIILPQSKEEQTAIANFLDQKTNQIDELITKKERLIRLLEEERTAIINQAVTKGLDSNVPMKDSGIEWLGEIPEHWKVKRLRNIVDTVKTGSTPPSEEEHYFKPEEINWYGPGDFENLILGDSKRKISNLAIDENKCRLFPKNSILLIGIGATVGKVGLALNACSSNQQINAIILKENYNVKFYLYFLSSIKEIIVMEASSATLPIFNQTQTKNIIVSVPSIKEQNEIVEFIENQSTRIQTILNKSKEEIELLKEYKTALINEVVTGKVDVREEVLN